MEKAVHIFSTQSAQSVIDQLPQYTIHKVALLETIQKTLEGFGEVSLKRMGRNTYTIVLECEELISEVATAIIQGSIIAFKSISGDTLKSPFGNLL